MGFQEETKNLALQLLSWGAFFGFQVDQGKLSLVRRRLFRRFCRRGLDFDDQLFSSAFIIGNTAVHCASS